MDLVAGRTPERPWALAAAALLALAGIGDAQFLVILHCFPGAQEALGCAAGSGCARLLASRAAAPLGVPLELWGVVAFSAVLVLLAATALGITARRRRRLGLALRVLTGAMVVVGMLLTLDAHRLAATCPYCRTAALIIGVLAVAVWCWRPGSGAAPESPDQPEEVPPAALAVPSRIAPLLWPVLLLPLALVLLVDVLLTVQAHTVVLRQGEVAVAEVDLRRMDVGPREGAQVVGAQAIRGYARRRLALHALEALADDRHAPEAAVLAPLLARPPQDAEVALRALLPAGAEPGVALADPSPLFVQAEDWALALPAPAGVSDGVAPAQVLLAIDATCPVCASEVRELAWTLDRLPHHPQVRVLVGAAPADAAAQGIAQALDRAPAGAAWPLLVTLLARADPGTWTGPELGRALATAAGPAALGSADQARIAARTEAVRRLGGTRPRPQLFLDGRRLAGFCPREALSALFAEIDAMRHAGDLLPDLAGLRASTTGSIVTPGDARTPPR